MGKPLDHILWAAPDFEAGVAEIGRLTGLQPAPGGSHPGLGTRNAVLSLGSCRYLEVIGPDPSQPLAGTYGALLAALPRPGIFTIAVRAGDLTAVAALARREGFKDAAARKMERRGGDGRLLSWQVLMLAGGGYGWSLPFFIDWAGAEHPADSAPAGCTLQSFEIQHPDKEGLAQLLDTFDVDIAVSKSPRPGFRAELHTPLGPLALTGAA